MVDIYFIFTGLQTRPCTHHKKALQVLSHPSGNGIKREGRGRWKCSIPLRHDWVNPPLSTGFTVTGLPWFIWWKEFCAGLWPWWYPYTVTFSPRQMFLSQNMVTLIPKSPYKHIGWSQHVPMPTASRQQRRWPGGEWGGWADGGCWTHAHASWRHRRDLEEPWLEAAAWSLPLAMLTVHSLSSSGFVPIRFIVSR